MKIIWRQSEQSKVCGVIRSGVCRVSGCPKFLSAFPATTSSLFRKPDFEDMSQAAKSLFVFGIHLCGLGLILLLIPNLILQIFGLPPTNDVWIRVNGMFVLCLSFYYVQTARNELTILSAGRFGRAARLFFTLPLLFCWFLLRKCCFFLVWLICCRRFGHGLLWKKMKAR